MHYKYVSKPNSSITKNDLKSVRPSTMHAIECNQYAQQDIRQILNGAGNHQMDDNNNAVMDVANSNHILEIGPLISKYLIL